MRLLVIPFLLVAQVVQADVLVTTRTIRANSIIGAEDVAIKKANVPGALTDPADVVGKEAKVALYPGRPMRPGDVGPPAIIERNQIVPLIYHQAGLRIATAGRALGRGATGEMVRVMNLTSRNTLFGHVRADGSVQVE